MPKFSNKPGLSESPPLTPIPENEEKPGPDDGSIAIHASPTKISSSSASDSTDSSPPSSPPSKSTSFKTVNFPDAETPVTSFSRPLTNAEMWPLYYFEQHARSCRQCFNPYATHKSGNSLCTYGEQLGLKVAELIYSKSDGQDIYAVADAVSNDMPTRVELPRQYVQVRSLLRAVERMVKCRRRVERRRVLEDEHDSARIRAARERQRSPPRTTRRQSSSSDDTQSQPRYYRTVSPAHLDRHQHRQAQSPSRPSRSTIRSYHESEFPSRRASTSTSSSSPSPARRPVEIVQAPSRPAPPPPPKAASNASRAHNPRTSTFPQSSASSAQIALPFRRASVSGITSGTTPPSSYRYKSGVDRPLAPRRSSSLTRESRAQGPRDRRISAPEKRGSGIWP